MSIQAVSWVLERTIPDPAAKLVMISLANALNGKSGKCFPTIEQIAAETSCSRSTVKRKLQWLSEMGWIDIHEARDNTGRQLANSYSIRFDLEPGEGFTVNLRGSSSEPGEGFNCEPPLKEPEEIPEEESLSETSSDAPRPTKKRISYPEPFEALWQAYPTDANMSKKEAFDAWRRIDEADRVALFASIPAFRAYCRAHPDYRPIHLCRYIAKRRFDGHGQPSPAPRADDATWQKRLRFARERKTWSSPEWGPRPNSPGCMVPQHLVQPTDGQGWAEFRQEQAA